MKKWKKFTGLTLTICLLAGFPAYATQIGPSGMNQGPSTATQAGTTGPSAGNSGTTAIGPDSSSGTTGTGAPSGNSSNTTGTTSVTKPVIQAEGAVVIDAATGNILYGKNERTRFYPASTTKLMTAMLVLERASLGETVTFSKTATTNLESGAVSLNLTEGDQLTVEQCLYGLLLKSANEIGNALAEHVAGSVSGFAELMNQKAAALGCTGTHFTNTHGLNDSNHYTTAYDMALIARAAFQNQTLCNINTTTSYKFPATKKEAARTITIGHKMMYPSDSRYYQGIIGGKTGYTSLAGNTLVTGVERNGVRIIAVVMKSKSTQYIDTKALLDYGFAVLGQNTSNNTTTNPSEPGAGSSTNSAPTTNPTVSGNTGTTSQGPGISSPSQPEPGNIGKPDGPGATENPGNSSSSKPTSTKYGWGQDSRGWYYIKKDGKRAVGEWLNIDQVEYWIDPNGYMATGWREFTNGEWYYFRESGAMAANYWTLDNGKWFYLGSSGAMLTNARTPDGYWVGADGVWVQ